MCLKRPGGAGSRREVFTIMVCLNGGYYLFTQLPRATGILFEVIPLIFLPQVDALAVGDGWDSVFIIPWRDPQGEEGVVTSGSRSGNDTRGGGRKKMNDGDGN